MQKISVKPPFFLYLLLFTLYAKNCCCQHKDVFYVILRLSNSLFKKKKVCSSLAKGVT